ncbi:aminotransferase class V-fold PLP-dependent enzyme [Paramaledivibacter caminithermalis]|jgi:cysteine desulfurase family protein|uniref:cysteine desulfurase n=1 Tax=Paramaledivibacter caminithermalis (strain DSM 15212 / CIP 107654 / DViRD3) TaxID=1121301 RepID=A0A1M6MNC2_PARC5|nr:aminotransferase class V-fold PLP-dependent enzyme [Paramaledivibacter caminithermalis]SHJ84978.1 cysteine desulfurase family protein [Paramaledivibacter caminithermalis DSM 15212]
MNGVYLDNGATSFPKAPGVVESISNYLNKIGCNVNRGAYASSFVAENIVYETRELLCQLFNYDKPENVVFTKNITESLNVLIKGLCKYGDHIIVSSMEHNAVMRPINSLNNKGVEYTKVRCNEEGELNPLDILKHIKKNTTAVIMTHASNVCGTILNLEEVGKICSEKGLVFIIDTAQTAGFLNVDYRNLKADAIAFTGHKGLLGPQGIGGFIINDSLVKEMDTFIEGGTGSLSEQEIQPQYMPDKFEAGTMNIPGIFGLNASLKYILKEGIEAIKEKELHLLEKFLNEVSDIQGVRLIGKRTLNNRTALVSLDFPKHDNAEISYKLYKVFGIMTRCGLHCAPSAHRTLKTFPKGTVRFSFSHFNTVEEVNYTINAIKEISRTI